MRRSAPEFEAFLKEIEERECCIIKVKLASSIKGSLQDYKIYVNKNIRRTPPRFSEKRSESEEYIPVEPGKHVVVARENEVHKNDRLESNEISVEIKRQQEVQLILSNINGNLKLTNENS